MSGLYSQLLQQPNQVEESEEEKKKKKYLQKVGDVVALPRIVVIPKYNSLKNSTSYSAEAWHPQGGLMYQSPSRWPDESAARRGIMIELMRNQRNI